MSEESTNKRRITFLITDKQRKALTCIAQKCGCSVKDLLLKQIEACETEALDTSVSPSNHRRVRSFKVHLTEKEKQLLAQRARRANMSQGAYIRACAIYNASPIEFDSELLAKVQYELYKIGTNLNQVAHAINKVPDGEKPHEAMRYKDAIDRVISRVKELVNLQRDVITLRYCERITKDSGNLG